MAVAFVAGLGSLFSTTGATTYTAAGGSDPSAAANTLLLASVLVTGGSGEEPPTVAGHGKTWSIVQSTLQGSTVRFIQYQADGNGANTTKFSVSGFGTNRTGCAISVAEFSGVKTTTIGVGAGNSIVQVPTIGSSAAATSLSSGTLAAYSHADNRPWAYTYHAANEVSTEDASPAWTTIHNSNYNNPAESMITSWINSQETTHTASWTTSSVCRAGIVEINGDTGGGGAATYPGWEGAGWWFRNEEWALRHGIPLLGEVRMLGEAREEGLIAA